MLVARSLSEITYDANSVVTIGTFDGVHLGHHAIIREVVGRARQRNGRSVVITFEPHPREIVGRGPVKQLATLEERLSLIESLDIDAALVLEFTYEFSRQTSREFYERYVVKGVGVQEVVVGHDHMFGRDREAGVEALEQLGREYGFTSYTVSAVSIGGEVVSSSKIREALHRGDVTLASRYLGRYYSIEGTIVHGDGRGAQLGFPTANIQSRPAHKLVPAEGVYLVSVSYGHRQFYGMLNIGVRPTFHSELNRTIEVHIFDFNESLVGKQLTVYFINRLSQEKKFSSKEELMTQLQSDKEECIKFIEMLQPS